MSIAIGTTLNIKAASGFDTVITFIKDSASWLGRNIVKLGKEYIWPALKAMAAFLRTGYGLAILTATLGVILLTTATTHQKRKAAPHCLDNVCLRVTMVIAAVGCFVATGFLIAAGTAALI